MCLYLSLVKHLKMLSTSKIIGCLAQLEERRPYKAKVGGSSPSTPIDLGIEINQFNQPTIENFAI